MRVLLLLAFVSAATPPASAGSWIARSFAGLLADADLVVVATVGDAEPHHAVVRVERVLSGPSALRGRDVRLPVVRCGQPGPDGLVYEVSTCLDRTYRAGGRMLLLLQADGAGYRETGYPEHTRFVLSRDDGDPVERAAALLALSATNPAARAEALAAMLADGRPAWRRDAAEAADLAVTLPPRAFSRLADPADPLRVALDRLADPLARLARTDPDAGVRAAAATALGRTSVAGGVTTALLAAAADSDAIVAHAAAGALRMRRDPSAADALLALAVRADDDDRRRALAVAAAPVVGTRHARALEALYAATAPDERAVLLAVWTLTGDPRAADEAARRLDAAREPWAADEALRTLGRSRDRRYAGHALRRLRPVVCSEVDGPFVAMEAVARLAPDAATVDALAAYLACPAASVRWHAATALTAIDLPASRAALVGHLHRESDAEVRGVIIAATGEVAPGEP